MAHSRQARGIGLWFGDLLSGFILLALFWALAAEADPFAPGGAFAGCKVRPQGEVGYDCGDLSINLMEVGRNTPAEAIGGLERLMRSRPSPPGAPVRSEVSRFEWPIAGQRWPGVRMVCITAAGKYCEFAEFVAFSRPDGAVWEVGCIAKGRQPDKEMPRCKKIVEYLASQEAPGGVSVNQPRWAVKGPPRLFSRILEVPEGCQVRRSEEEGGRIECPTSMLHWAFQPAHPGFDTFFSGVVEQIKKSMPVRRPQEHAGPCNVEGISGRCVLLEGKGPQGRLHTYVGAARRGSRGLVIACSFQERGEGEPLLCKGIFSNLPARQARP